MPASVLVSPPVPPMIPESVVVVPPATSKLPPPAASVMARAEERSAVVASVPDVVASPRVSPPADAPRAPSAEMLSVLFWITEVPPA